jgi:hypothetical protein
MEKENDAMYQKDHVCVECYVIMHLVKKIKNSFTILAFA